MGFSWRAKLGYFALSLLVLGANGCGSFAARRLAQAPNSYPRWLAPEAPVTIGFSSKILTAFTNRQIHISSPPARINYRIIQPGDYHFRWTNRLDEARGELDLHFTADIPASTPATNSAALESRGTVVIIHGYGVSGPAMLPWAFLLAQEDWRCVLVDLRGHGESTSERVYFGPQEVRDLVALFDHLQATGVVTPPLSLVGHSFGAVVALRWKSLDPRVDRVVAMAPYADLSRAVQNIRREYARWIPKSFIESGLKKLPDLLAVEPCELEPSCWIDRTLSGIFFIAGGADRIATLDQVQSLFVSSSQRNRMKVIHNAAHETLPFYLDELATPITEWLSPDTRKQSRFNKAPKTDRSLR
jgi:pimeloyl-ACP methyl ester carboxylesterase